MVMVAGVVMVVGVVGVVGVVMVGRVAVAKGGLVGGLEVEGAKDGSG